MSDSKIKVGIIGGAGYTGGELLRLLLRHPVAAPVFVQSSSQADKYLSEIHADLVGETDMRFSGAWHDAVDVLFLCMGHGQAREWLSRNAVPERIRIIDLSSDFRYTGDNFVYGLPELCRSKIRTATNIANPGCFATAIQLSLLPLATDGLLGAVHVSGLTGSTGAGQALQDTVHFSWRHSNIQAYKTLQHQHVGEVEHTLQIGSPESRVLFVPYRGDFTRGIYTTAYTRTDLDIEAARMRYRQFYQEHPFTHIAEQPIALKQVVNTNKCLLYLEKQQEYLIIHAVIDNLLKGASGQAVQNMNILFGLDETAGLLLKPGAF
jgi:N-acetyl-gamma-glutamyl-phosphate reductase